MCAIKAQRGFSKNVWQEESSKLWENTGGKVLLQTKLTSAVSVNFAGHAYEHTVKDTDFIQVNVILVVGPV